MAGKFKQGVYSVINESKYEGNASNVVYRSSWEKRTMIYLDSTPNVLQWSSEEVVVIYYNPTDQKYHRYFLDFKAKINTPSGIKTLLIEIKPEAETVKPIPPKRNTRKAHSSYQTAIETYIKNQCKWEAASKYAKDRGWEFIVLTERQLFPTKLKR